MVSLSRKCIPHDRFWTCSRGAGNTDRRYELMKDTRPTRSNPPGPKRGAFPPPPAEIESATPYFPQSPPQTDRPNPETNWPIRPDRDRKKSVEPSEPK